MKAILEQHPTQCAEILDDLLAAEPFPFDDHLKSRLPEKHGVYAITRKDASGEVEYLYAGRSHSGATGLRRRIVDDHFNDRGGRRAAICLTWWRSDSSAFRKAHPNGITAKRLPRTFEKIVKYSGVRWRIPI